MRAAVLTEYGEPLDVREIEEPDPASHGVVVDVDACGVCRSDWHAWHGHGEWADDRVPLGQVLGHEPAGEIVAVGDEVTARALGERVAVPFSLGCGSCPTCRNGHGNVCADDRALGFEASTPGAFAERVHVPNAEYNVTPLPDGVSPVAMAALGCRYVTAYNALARRADLEAGEWLAVVGCGGVGLSAVQLGAAMGARVLAVDLDGAALDLAADLGARATVDATDDPARAIRDLTDGGAHVALDALGSAETFRTTIECLRRRGRHVQVGLTGDDERGEAALPVDELVRNEIDLLGARGLSPTRYGDLFDLLAGGAIDPGELVTREVSLEDVSDRLAAMDDYGVTGVEVVTEF
ncbi:zinc-binding dehydrogenase [Halococcus hamelinensis]|uniref:Alcohol dehydrogenase GroES domain protein n=3 Tax=Halococcus hamelinensis TaxID=332168 RepID=M0M245_9EURY|nr:alcohol dehydrogenase catalytic domain-containing protein [Halococcus hamelinensis]EMA39771.1 alcohol dehydrogenase GroES domain protein [Halococcus hamelinensis 100A6]